MRNLKKVLALTLAIALVLSLSVTAGAVNFSDKKDITAKYQDAVDLMSELSIMNGFPDGTYQPQGELTRAQYLKMLYVVMNRGVDDQAVLYKDVQPFPFYDVRDYDWFNGYVKWGYGRQLIDGFGGGVFQPNGTVTGFQALKMSLTALGFSSEIEGYTGDAWKTQVLNDAQDAGLLLNLETENLSVNLTREAAAQLLHNTLFSQTVRYNTTYIPAKMEKGQTMAYTYYNLYTLRGVVVANEWASASGSKSLAGESRIVAESSNIPKDMEGNNIGTGTYDLPYKAPLDMLGKEVVVYVRYANNYTTRPFDKVYGNMLVTSRNVIKPYYAEVDVTGTLNNSLTSGDKSDLDFYVVDGDFLDSSYNKVSGATVIVNYSGNVSSTNKILAGSPITFIDYNNDGNYDYVIAYSLTYAKVSEISSDNKITVIAGEGSDFDGAKTLSAKAKADVYGSEDIKVDDRVLVYPVDGKYGVMIVAPTKGTLTVSKNNGTVATISGTDYKQTLLASRVSSLNDILVAENFGVEREYYYYAGKVLEGYEPGSASKVWALVRDSWTSGNSTFNTNDRQVQLLLADGSTGIYVLNDVMDAAGNEHDLVSYGSNKIAVDVNKNKGADVGTDYILDDTASNIVKNIFRAAVSEDGKSVTLYEDGTRAALGTTAGNIAYKKGNTTITATASSANKVLNNTVWFMHNTTTDKFGVYTGRALADVTAGDVAASNFVSSDISGSLSALPQDAIRAAVLQGATVPVSSADNRKFGYVLSEPTVSYDSAAGKYYATITVFNGTETVTLTGKNDVRSKYASPYTEALLDTAATGLTGGSTTNLSVRKGRVIEYTLNAEGKISAMVTLTPAGNNLETLFTSGDNAYLGWYVVGNTGYLTFYPNDGAVATKAVYGIDDDADFYSINSGSTDGRVLTALPSSTDRSAKKALFFVESGEVTKAWVLEGASTIDIVALAATQGVSSGPSYSSLSSSTVRIASDDGSVIMTGSVDPGKYLFVGYSYNNITNITGAFTITPVGLTSYTDTAYNLPIGATGATIRLWFYNTISGANEYLDVKYGEAGNATELAAIANINSATNNGSGTVTHTTLATAGATGALQGFNAAYLAAAKAKSLDALTTKAAIQSLVNEVNQAQVNLLATNIAAAAPGGGTSFLTDSTTAANKTFALTTDSNTQIGNYYVLVTGTTISGIGADTLTGKVSSTTAQAITAATGKTADFTIVASTNGTQTITLTYKVIISTDGTVANATWISDSKTLDISGATSPAAVNAYVTTLNAAIASSLPNNWAYANSAATVTLTGTGMSGLTNGTYAVEVLGIECAATVSGTNAVAITIAAADIDDFVDAYAALSNHTLTLKATKFGASAATTAQAAISVIPAGTNANVVQAFVAEVKKWEALDGTTVTVASAVDYTSAKVIHAVTGPTLSAATVAFGATNNTGYSAAAAAYTGGLQITLSTGTGADGVADVEVTALTITAATVTNLTWNSTATVTFNINHDEP